MSEARQLPRPYPWWEGVWKIEIAVTPPGEPGLPKLNLKQVIDEATVEMLRKPRVAPPIDDHYGYYEFRSRMDRREALARHLGMQLAHEILEAIERYGVK